MKKGGIALIIFVFLILLTASCGREEGLDQVLEREIPRLMEAAEIPGLSIALIRNGEIYWTGAFGVKSTDTNEPVDEETMFEAASLSKTVSAVTALKLVERGELDLDRPLYEYLPYPKLANDERYKKITARLVLTHTSGLPNWGNRLIREPGERFGYSGEGFLYLGRTVEKLTGMTLQEFAKKEIFDPLGMTRTCYVWNDLYAENGATGHDRHGLAMDRRQTTESNAGASLLTTPKDYARFLIAVMDDVVLKSETTAQMLSPQVKAYRWEENEPDDHISWGFGWGVQPGNETNGFFHWGNNDDLRGLTIGYKEKKEGLVFFANSENCFALAKPLLDLITDEPQWILLWFNWKPYDDPESMAVRSFEKAFLEQGADAGMDKLAEIKEQFPELIDANALSFFAQYLSENDKFDEAVSLFKLSLETNPKNTQAYSDWALAELDRGRFKDALAVCDKWLEVFSGSVLAKRGVTWVEELIRVEKNPVSVPLEVLESYAGDYGPRHIILRDGILYYRRGESIETRLVPLSADTFYLVGIGRFRIRFENNEKGEVTHLTGLYIEGRTDHSDKNR